MLYTGYHMTEPSGHVVHCHQQCGIENRYFNTKGKRGNLLDIYCRGCNSYCTISRAHHDQSSLLGVRNLVKTPYPQEKVRVEWRLGRPGAQLSALPTPEPAPASTTPRSTTPPMPLDCGLIPLAMHLSVPPPVARLTSLPVPPTTPDPEAIPQQQIALPANQLQRPVVMLPAPTPVSPVTPYSMVSLTEPRRPGLKIRFRDGVATFITPSSSVSPTPSSSASLTPSSSVPIRPSSTASLIPPSSLSPIPITRSSSAPQMDLRQDGLKRSSNQMLELSTSQPRNKRHRQKKE
jgi:hypothetical protein